MMDANFHFGTLRYQLLVCTILLTYVVVHHLNNKRTFLKNSPTISLFKRELVCLVKLSKKSYFAIHDIEGIRLFTRLRIQFSDLREHKFRHKFQCSGPTCICQTGIENNDRTLLPASHRRDLLGCTSNVVGIDIRNLS